jgi:hypothetical protein
MRRSLILSAVLACLASPLAFADPYDKVNGAMDVPANINIPSADTVNGAITVGENSFVRSIDTVNGSIRLRRGAGAGSIDNVNGGIELENDVRVEKSIDSVNGAISLRPGVLVRGDVENVNGKISLDAARVEGRIDTVWADIELKDGSQVLQGIRVEKPSMWSWGKQRPPTITIGANCQVQGELRFEHEVSLYVHESAAIGTVIGAEVVRFSGSRP